MHRSGMIDEELAATELFRGVPGRRMRTISALPTRVEFQPGKVLTKEGHWGSQFMILLSGAVAVSTHERVIATRGSGDFLGEISMLGGRPQTATALATTPVVISVFSKRDFVSLLHEAPAVADVLQATMAERLLELAAVQDDRRPSRVG
jgi:CRP/FNR family cyclic AMP-dependent transcriptional regulator